jgi:outer membrane biosynthesis protein TonB
VVETISHHWRSDRYRLALNAAVVLSAAVHLAVFTLAATKWRPLPPRVIPISYEVQFLAPPTPEPEPEAKPVKAAPPPPKKVEPKPEPKKEEPKPAPKKEPEKPAEKKPEPKKELEPKKEEPKKEPPKNEPEKKAEPAPAAVPQPEVVAKAPPAQTGVQRQQLPSILNVWGRNVQRQVEKFWMVPGGVSLTGGNLDVEISFWVGRDGMLLSQPVVLKPGVDPALANSGIQAVINAQPLPPLPIEFVGDRQEVIYVFSLSESVNASGGTL